ncbi:hypothetical protein B0H21DRAFT_56528 [Amylocystis lapponica]|nr:hypothetical protein B0H21DRAFT_56528 [Amylocystis lapponica]
MLTASSPTINRVDTTESSGAASLTRSDPGASPKPPIPKSRKTSRFLPHLFYLSESTSEYLAEGDGHQLKTLEILENKELMVKMRSDWLDLYNKFNQIKTLAQGVDDSEASSKRRSMLNAVQYQQKARALKNRTVRSSMTARSSTAHDRFNETLAAVDHPNANQGEHVDRIDLTAEQLIGMHSRGVHMVVLRHDGLSGETCTLCRFLEGLAPLPRRAYGVRQAGNEEACRTGTDGSPVNGRSPPPDTVEKNSGEGGSQA